MSASTSEWDCSICHETLVDPHPCVYECNNGHILCDKCETKEGKCPHCQVVMIPGENKRRKDLERIIQIKAGNLDCMYRPAGCKHVLPNTNTLKDHEKICPYSKKESLVPRALVILDMSRSTRELNAEAINSVLDKVGDRPIVVICVSGQARSGKSFLLNAMLKHYQSKNEHCSLLPPGGVGFDSEGGADGVTQGIHLWSEPFVPTAKGDPAVLFIDTQGLSDIETPYRTKAIIFTVASLLSSVMIFNQTSKLNHLLDDTLLQEFERYASLTQAIAKTLNHDTAKLRTHSNVGLTRKLWFVQRDHVETVYPCGLHAIRNREPEEPKDKKKNFCWNQFYGSFHKEYLETRRTIQELFQDISVYLVPSPGEDFMCDSALAPADKFTKYKDTLLEKLSTPRYLSTAIQIGHSHSPVSARQFPKVVRSLELLFQNSDTYFADAISVKELRDNAAFFKEIQTEKEIYDREAKSLRTKHKLGISNKDLQKLYKTTLNLGNEKLKQHTLGTKKYLEQWEKILSQRHAAFKKKNDGKKKRALLFGCTAGGVVVATAVVGGIACFAAPVAGVDIAGVVIAEEFIVVGSIVGGFLGGAVGGFGVGTGVERLKNAFAKKDNKVPVLDTNEVEMNDGVTTREGDTSAVDVEADAEDEPNNSDRKPLLRKKQQ